MAHRVLDRGMADRQRAFRHRLAGLLGEIRQPRLVVLLGGGRRGIDIAAGRRQIRLPAEPVRNRLAPSAAPGCFGAVGRNRDPWA